MKRILVCGAGGFIGSHLVERFKLLGHYVDAVDIKTPPWNYPNADKWMMVDLRQPEKVTQILRNNYDEIYQVAADMGGAGYIFSGQHDAEIVTNNAQINLNILKELPYSSCRKIFFSSSACVYPLVNQTDPLNPNCAEDTVYPANPDSEYGWEKLFSERLYLSYARTHNIDVKIARLHNVFGPRSPYRGGREKVIAALCRKVIEETSTIDVWGNGNQTRTFLYIVDCITGIEKIMSSQISQPINLGSSRLISINDVAQKIINLSGKSLTINNIEGPEGVQGRTSDNTLIRSYLNWEPSDNLDVGLAETYNWIKNQIESI
ncbi:MAG: NAD-dependent epimerase/dehydratase family protein [Synechococcaceae bacterium WB8_1B_057]|nr:NAD-dependent epimerase/dehydratase family protein [Synechococcaceae bacterium WB6_1A_059]NDG79404.1 NAD-dependent epimerase/dehydratase family protein [Synechococcaceae bacterium WB8_1B_057]